MRHRRGADDQRLVSQRCGGEEGQQSGGNNGFFHDKGFLSREG